MSVVQSQPVVAADPYRVIVVDDSAVIRGLTGRWLREDPAISVVGLAENGLAALKLLERCDPEVAILDIEMPQMDGLTALPKLLALKPDLKIVMSSTLTLRNADISVKAMSLGAADYIPKPTSTREMTAAQDFQQELLNKVKALGASVRRRRGLALPGAETKPAAPAANGESADRVAIWPAGPIVLRQGSRMPPKILAIGSSTGGPQALSKLFEQLKDRVKLPILITQHMPPNFTAILAEHLNRASGLPAAEAVQGELVQGGRIYVAPGDWHMTVEGPAEAARISLNQNARENFCRPAVDPMLRSLAAVYGDRVLTVILTGMGQDGMVGSRALVEKGGTVIAQDEATSVVWGMPGAVATQGLCSAVVPLDAVAGTIEQIISGRTK